MRKVSLTIIFLLFFYLAYAQREPYTTFRFANTLYGQGKYREAAEEYENILNKGWESGNIYYNLGNAYFKLGRMGEAILNYEKAKRLIPRDAELNANLKFALSKVNLDHRKAGGVIERRALRFTTGELTAYLLLSYLTLIFILGVRLFMKEARKILNYAALFTCTVLLLVAVLFSVNVYNTQVIKRAIVLTDDAECRFEPQSDATVFFQLYEGEDVIVRDISGEWAKIERFDGRVGWVKLELLGLI